MFYVITTAVLIGVAMVIWQFSNPEIFNSWNDLHKVIYNTKGINVEAIYETFKNLDTPLGKPWLGNIGNVKTKCMIFGPNADGEYIYIADQRKNRLLLCHSSIPEWIKVPEGEAWRLVKKVTQDDCIDDVIRYRFATAYMLNNLTTIFSRYIETGIANVGPIHTDANGTVYRFNENFKLLGEDFYLYDLAGHKQMKISSNLPNKTFHFKWLADDTEVFRLTKRIFHILPHYDLYEQGNKIGRMKKNFDLIHDHFIADTTYGKLELKSVNATFGKNFQVFINERPIGTISEKLNINFNNIFFDNFVMVVNNPKYVPLMASMVIMVAREKKRDHENLGYEVN